MQLKLATLSAGRWTAASTIVRSGLQLLQTAILARLLAPSEFGLMAITLAWLAILSLLTDFGFSRALIHFQNTSNNVRSSLFWFNLLLAISLTLVFIIISPIVATLYRSPELSHILIMASLSLPLSACSQQFRVLTEKELCFGPLARYEIAAAVIGFMVSLILALHGIGAMALVAGLLASTAVNSMLAWLYLSTARRPIWRLRLDDIRPYLRFGGYMVGESLTNILQLQADIFIGGAVAGPAALGLYNLPRDLSLRIANTVVNPVLTRISFPVMAKAQGDKKTLQKIYLSTLRITASINFPIYIALALFAEEIVAVLYGAQWSEAVGYLRILAIWGLIRSTGNPSGSLIYAVGRPRLAFWWNIAQLVAVPPILFLCGKYWGLTGISWAMLCIQLVVLPTAWRFLIYPCCDVSFRDYIGCFFAAISCAVLAGSLSVLVSYGISPAPARLLMGLILLAATYWLLSLKFNRLWITTLSALLGWGGNAKQL
jgi:lipopolysaccharide exporter